MSTTNSIFQSKDKKKRDSGNARERYRNGNLDNNMIDHKKYSAVDV
jgi:hypothetical protein